MGKVFVKKKTTRSTRDFLLVSDLVSDLLESTRTINPIFSNDVKPSFVMDNKSKEINVIGSFFLREPTYWIDNHYPKRDEEIRLKSYKEWADTTVISIKNLFKGYSFNRLMGSMDFSYTGVENLDGLPLYMEGDLECVSNKITAIPRLPTQVGEYRYDKNYSFKMNELTDFPLLENFEHACGDVFLDDNKISWESKTSKDNLRQFLQNIKSTLFNSFKKINAYYDYLESPEILLDNLRNGDLVDNADEFWHVEQRVYLDNNPILEDSTFLKLIKDFYAHLKSEMKLSDGVEEFITEYMHETMYELSGEVINTNISRLFTAELHYGQGFYLSINYLAFARDTVLLEPLEVKSNE